MSFLTPLIKAIEAMSVNTAALTAAVQANTDATTALLAFLESNNDTTAQAAVDAATTQVEANTAQLVAATGTTSGAGTLTLSPTSFTGTPGAAFNQSSTISGGTAPYTLGADTLPVGLTASLSGDTLSIDGTYATGSGSVTVTDSSSPQETSGAVALTFG